MNQRQKLKKLKRDNKLMHDIINDCPAMQNLYDSYNNRLNVSVKQIPVKEYRCRRFLEPRYINNTEYIDDIKKRIAYDMVEVIENNITYLIHKEMYGDDMSTYLIGSIFIADGAGDCSDDSNRKD